MEAIADTARQAVFPFRSVTDAPRAPEQVWDGDKMSVPLVFTADEMFLHFLFRGGDVSAEDLDIALGRVGRDDGPALLIALFDAYILEPSVLAGCVGDVWNAAEYPERCLDAWEWDALFTTAGYTVNGEPAERPAGTLTLYRGRCPPR